MTIHRLTSTMRALCKGPRRSPRNYHLLTTAAFFIYSLNVTLYTITPREIPVQRSLADLSGVIGVIGLVMTLVVLALKEVELCQSLDRVSFLPKNRRRA